MPEMPEVETIRRSLNDYLEGKTIEGVEILLPRQIKWPGPEEFAGRLVGKTVKTVSRRGKYLLFELTEETTLIVHLRMTGRLLYSSEGEIKDGHPRIIFHLKGEAKLIYGDTRTLGALYVLKPGEEHIVKGLNEMGPEPLTPEFTPAYLEKIFSGKRTKVKSALLDQKIVGGIGNIYADEALFLAKIHPERTVNTLQAGEISALHGAINKVIGEGIADGGTTFRDYQNAEGGQGAHQDKLWAYNRQGEPCRVCQTPIVKITVGGRGTHFCPRCQRRVGQ